MEVLKNLMEVLKNLVGRKWVLVGACVVVGIVLGLIYAWEIDELEVINTTPDMLRQDLREDYLRMVVDSYSVNRDIELAIQRYESLGEYGEDTLEAVGANPGLVDPSALQNFRAVISMPITPEGGQDQGVAGDEQASPWRIILPVGGVIVLVGVAIATLLYKRSQWLRGDDIYAPQPAQGLNDILESRQVRQQYEAGPVHDPLATFRTTYALGDDSYDDSFSIESAAGDFLGECGV